MKSEDWKVVIGLTLAVGRPDLAYELNKLREQSGFTDPIDWSELCS